MGVPRVWCGVEQYIRECSTWKLEIRVDAILRSKLQMLNPTKVLLRCDQKPHYQAQEHYVWHEIVSWKVRHRSLLAFT